MPDTPPAGQVSPLRDGGGRHALLMLYLAPFLAGTALADWLSIPVFASLFALADVARASPALPLGRRLLRSGLINTGIVTLVFLLGRSFVWTKLIPQAPIELWLTIGMAAIAALILRRLWANHRTAQFAAQSLASLTGGAVAEPQSRRAAISFELDLFAEVVETDGITEAALDDLTRALVKLDTEAAVQTALLARRNDGPQWRAALYTWLAHPFVTGQGLTGHQVADLFLQGMANRQMQLLAARAAMVWAEGHDFGADRAAVQATVSAHLAAPVPAATSGPLPLDPDPSTLRACLEQLDRTLRSA